MVCAVIVLFNVGNQFVKQTAVPDQRTHTHALRSGPAQFARVHFNHYPIGILRLNLKKII